MTRLQTFEMPSYHRLSRYNSERNRLICIVCGSLARGFNFGAITCMSCKVFFRRNAYTEFGNLHCRNRGNCQITQKTRKYCTHCRLIMCFRVGMKRELFRNYRNEHDLRRITYQKANIKINPLLQWSNQSLLTNQDCIQINQICSIFNSQTKQLFLQTQDIYHYLSSIGIQPLKIRIKPSCIYDLIHICNQETVKFIHSISKLNSLPLINIEIILLRNLRLIIMLYTHYQMKFEPIHSLIHTPSWLTSMDCLFSNETREIFTKIQLYIHEIIELDPCLIQLILTNLIFSATDFHSNRKISFNEYYHRYHLENIQNFYINILWKYMIHRFGNIRSIRLFSDLIKIVLHIQAFISSIENSKILFEQKLNDYLIPSIDCT